MPQPVYREAVRMLVADVGYQEASKRTGIAYGTLRQWANRGKWNVMRPHSQAVTAVTKAPADAHADILREHGEATKLALSAAARRGAEHLASAAPSAIVKSHHALRNITAAGSQLHGWEAKNGPAANVMVNIALLGVEPSSVQVQGEIVDCDT